MTFRMV